MTKVDVLELPHGNRMIEERSRQEEWERKIMEFIRTIRAYKMYSYVWDSLSKSSTSPGEATIARKWHKRFEDLGLRCEEAFKQAGFIYRHDARTQAEERRREATMDHSTTKATHGGGHNRDEGGTNGNDGNGSSEERRGDIGEDDESTDDESAEGETTSDDETTDNDERTTDNESDEDESTDDEESTGEDETSDDETASDDNTTSDEDTTDGGGSTGKADGMGEGESSVYEAEKGSDGTNGVPGDGVDDSESNVANAGSAGTGKGSGHPQRPFTSRQVPRRRGRGRRRRDWKAVLSSCLMTQSSPSCRRVVIR